jgi:hypothetical protein
MEQSSNMIDMIPDAERFIDDVNNTGTCPEVRFKSGTVRSFKENLFESIPLATIKARGPSKVWTGSDAGNAALSMDTFPAANTSSANAEDSGDFNRGMAGFKESDGAQAALFKNCCFAGWSHGIPPPGNIGHCLCRSQ